VRAALPCARSSRAEEPGPATVTLIGKAWRGVQRFVQDIRIDADWPRYESEQRVAHEAEASRRFNTSQLEREIAEIQRKAEAEGHAVFGDQIRLANSSIKGLYPAISHLRCRLELLTRDYRQELNQLHEDKLSLLGEKQDLIDEMKLLKEQRAEAHGELRDAYDSLQQAKEAVAGWHAKSARTPMLFGNSGKRLPNHSLFGQSFGDLDGYKADRERACDEISSCKSALAQIGSEQNANRHRWCQNEKALKQVFESVKAVKEARQRMFDLKKQGVRRHLVEAELSKYVRQEMSLQKGLDRLSEAMDEYVLQQSFRMGMEERRRDVADLTLKRAQFLAEFEDPLQAAERQHAHREWWINGRESS